MAGQTPLKSTDRIRKAKRISRGRIELAHPLKMKEWQTGEPTF